ncbi:NADH:flavin oxidoreductase/NADH oxidase [Okeania sp. KiyG1]|uniref:NADH:flavin oxidoreductase/NADH oxidase n=1 Tax=Okeania sp. KiyG1 TaxID=2720165 RepID=UPI001921BC23|nr:NADH:flavin oxidoreductase/NADH oxidase [Okeania sp. KiyG1]GFZ93295.1 FMN oxidoreductase [Okeania sp. KiyG1]
MTHLFEPLKIREVTLRNRIGMSPMCQYWAEDGLANDWHLVHLGSRAIGGAGLVVMEDTAVSPDGRISSGDLGIWSDEHIKPLARITNFLSIHGAVPGIQLGHAGRKASCSLPWEGGKPRSEGRHLELDEGGWEIFAPSAIPFGDERPRIPKEMTIEDINSIKEAFQYGARRAYQAGFKFLMLHASHGYLFQEFYSPITNHRNDQYGGSFENRIRFLLEVVRLVRQEWPETLPLSVRLAAQDYIEGGWTLEEAIQLSQLLKNEGIDLIDNMAFGAVATGAKVPFGRAFLVADATTIKQSVEVLVAASALSDPDNGTQPEFINEQIASGNLDLVFLGRELLVNPYWPQQAAKALGQTDKISLPVQYAHWLK